LLPESGNKGCRQVLQKMIVDVFVCYKIGYNKMSSIVFENCWSVHYFVPSCIVILKGMLVEHLLFGTSILQLSSYKRYILRCIRKGRETGLLLYYFLLSEKQQSMYATQIQHFGLERGSYPCTECAGEETITPFTLVSPYIFLSRTIDLTPKSHVDDVSPCRFSTELFVTSEQQQRGRGTSVKFR